MILNLRFVSYFKAPNGANFDLLADDQLENFFIKLKQLWTAVSSTKTFELFKKDFNQTFLANVRADFLPKFYKQHVPVRCGAQYIPDTNFELGDTPKLEDSLKDFFETFDNACRNFKSQLLEAQS